MLVSKIFVTGDTHSMVDIDKLRYMDFEEKTGVNAKELTKDDYVIVCGDFGVLWHTDDPKKCKTVNWYENHPWTTLFVDGNHEQFYNLYRCPVEDWHGGKVHRVSNSVIHLMRGQIFDIDGLSFFTMGGATSIDVATRKLGVDLFEEELPSCQEYETALNNLEKCNWDVDYILTHCCSDAYQIDVLRYGNLRQLPDVISDSLTEFLRQIEFEHNIKFKHWYFGHYHRDARVDQKHTCLYNGIIQIK